MDGLWDPPPNHQEIEDTNCGKDGCQCAFCLANDVVEETTQNEISCIEVLRILISKADTDIIELEDELMDLLSQLVSTDEEFSNMFSMYLRREIDFLDLSIRKLKNDSGSYLPTTTRKPAESMLEILNSLFSLYIQKKNKKFADNKNNIETASCQVHSDISFKEKKQTGSCSNANQMEKNKSVINTSLEKDTSSEMKVKVEEEEDTDFPISFLYTGHSQGSMEKWKHLVGKIKSQTDAESKCCSKSTSIESSVPNTKQIVQNNSDVSLSLSLSSTNIYNRRQTLNSPLQTNSTSPSPLLEKADVANTHSGVHMDCYKVEELRAMAKERGLKGYSKLRKFKLAQLLGIKIVEGTNRRRDTCTYGGI